MTESPAEISNNTGEYILFIIFPCFPCFSSVFHTFMCAELQSPAETQPTKPEDETMVSFVFLTLRFLFSTSFL